MKEKGIQQWQRLLSLLGLSFVVRVMATASCWLLRDRELEESEAHLSATEIRRTMRIGYGEGDTDLDTNRVAQSRYC